MAALKKFLGMSFWLLMAIIGMVTNSQAEENYEDPTCYITNEKDKSTDGTLRNVFENILNNNSAGGCNISEVIKNENGLVLYDFADRTVADNLVLFITPEACQLEDTDPPCDPYVRNFKIKSSLKISPKQSVMVGNLSEGAITEMYDFYDDNGDGVLHKGYQDLIDWHLDYGSVILDLTKFDDKPAGDDGIVCGGSSKTTYLRNFGIISGKIDSLTKFYETFPCLGDGGGNRFCYGTLKSDVDSLTVDIHGNPDNWCEPKCDFTEIAYVDADGDGFGDANDDGFEYCPDDGFPTNASVNRDDCNDDDDTIHPGQTETCDFVDRDCDGQRFKDATDTKTFYRDSDRDGFGDENIIIKTCTPVSLFGQSATAGDCDDTNSAVHPGATDICNDTGIDYDCDGTVIPGSTWYVDADSDTYGDPLSVPATACTQPLGYSADIMDCLDTDPAVYPSALEVCNDGVDQNCDGSDDTSCVGILEICTDGIDNDGVNGTDCEDPACSADSACTVSVEICDDGLDNDFNTFTDCADVACDSSSHCNAKEPELICDDGQDNDVDLAIDCDDTDCAFTDVCVLDKIETSCQDGIDDEPDSLTDCFDPDCADIIIFEGTDASGNPVSLTCLDMLDVNSTCQTYSTTDGDGDGLPDCVDGDIIPPPPVSSGGCSGNCDLNAQNQMTETQLMMSFGFMFLMILIMLQVRHRVEITEKARGL